VIGGIMGKDPAILFYTSDFLVGTYYMTNEQVGRYIRLLCMQHQQGHLSEERMLNICKTYDKDIFEKFIKDDNGLYYNKRLDEEANKRRNYVESRRNSRIKSAEDDVRIYLIADSETKYIKIGSSVNPKRRFAEMCNQQNPAITVGKDRLYDLIFESRVVLREEEIKLHTHFDSKRITGEWFNLSSDDIKYIRKTYGERTENENANEDTNRITSINELRKDLKINDLSKEVIEYLNNKIGSKFRNTDANKKHISARVREGATLDEFKTVIDKKSKVWLGTEWQKFLRPETLFGTKFDSYLNEKEVKQSTGNHFMDRLQEMGEE